ncbi:MAG: winged helix-turn-helix transcriptional regulator [Chloroflexi bacterium]|nr:winged helix-turn-helix transcriptional regulator [Chloroflexota bacterium]
MPKESLYEFVRQAVPCVGFNTRRATRLVTQYYDKTLAPSGLRSTQYSLLSALSMMDEASMQELAHILAMDRTTLTRNLSPLLRKGLVKVKVGSDRRSRPLTLTPKGQSTLEKALPYWEKAQSRIVNEIGAEQWDLMMRGLHQISMIVEENT